MDIEQTGITVSSMVALGWKLILLAGSTKRPAGSEWEITSDPHRVYEHVEQGGGVGLLLGREAGLMCVDADDMDGFRALEQQLGALPVHSVGRPDRPGHSFFVWQEGMAGAIKGLDGSVVADLKGGTGGRAFVVLPSATPYESGGNLWPRRWTVDPRVQPFGSLPQAWAEHAKRSEAVQAELPRTEVGAGWRLSQRDEAALHNAHARKDVWRNGNRNSLASALSALLRLKGVEAFQIVGLIRDIAMNARDGEMGQRLSAARASIRRVDNGQPVRGASVYRDLGLEDLLATVDAIVEEAEARHLGLTVLGGR